MTMTRITQIEDRGAAVAWSPVASHADFIVLGAKVRFEVFWGRNQSLPKDKIERRAKYQLLAMARRDGPTMKGMLSCLYKTVSFVTFGGFYSVGLFSQTFLMSHSSPFLPRSTLLSR
jgi:hypothetical protein